MKNPLMSTAVKVETAISTYFELCKAEAVHPTPAGMALALNFDTTNQLLTAVRNDPADPDIEEEPLRFLRRGITRLEQYYTENGLKDLLPPAFTKLMLSAYFDINEKSVKKEEHDQTIRIVWEEKPRLGPPVKHAEVIEVEDHYTGDIQL